MQGVESEPRSARSSAQQGGPGRGAHVSGLSRERAPFHSLALTFWVLLAMLPSVLTANPVLVAVALFLVVAIHQQVARRSPTAAAWGSFARFALFFVLFTLVFNVLMGGAGETVLVELPAWKIQDEAGGTLFQVGGAVTLESLAFGVARAAALLAVIYALATFNALVDHSQLLRGLPRWLDQGATIVSIAVAFMPQLVAAQRDLREALALRGHRLRKLRDFVPLILTLLGEALERAISLAESMEARGYSGPPLPVGERRRPRQLIALGLLLLGFGAVVGDLAAAGSGESGTGGWARWWPPMALLAGATAIVFALRSVGRRNRRTRYRRELWRPRDTGLTLLSLLAGGFLLVGFFANREDFAYLYFPSMDALSAPWAVLVPMLALLALLVLHPREGQGSATRPSAEMEGGG